MKKVINQALIFSLLMCLMYVLTYRQIIPATNALLALSLVVVYGIIFFFLVRSIKNKYFKHKATFGVLFKQGFGIALVATLVSSVFVFVYLTYIDKGALERQKEISQKVIGEQMEVLGEDSIAFKRGIEEVNSISENPKNAVLGNITSSLVLYSVFTFFSAAILRTRNSEIEETS